MGAAQHCALALIPAQCRDSLRGLLLVGVWGFTFLGLFIGAAQHCALALIPAQCRDSLRGLLLVGVWGFTFLGALRLFVGAKIGKDIIWHRAEPFGRPYASLGLGQ